jgi:hypothetical protein
LSGGTDGIALPDMDIEGFDGEDLVAVRRSRFRNQGSGIRVKSIQSIPLKNLLIR